MRARTNLVWPFFINCFLLLHFTFAFSPFFCNIGQKLLDKNKTEVYLMGVIPTIMHELHTSEVYKDTKVAWVSCCDEPRWANECLAKFETIGGVKLNQVAHSSQIFKDNKQAHFKNLKAEFPDIEYHEMLFFDNEPSNISNVKKLGVKCVLCPDGVTAPIWDKGLAMFKS